MADIQWVNSYIPDHGMNSCSTGIEMMRSDNEPHPTVQLKALDRIIAYIYVHYGF